MANELDLKQSAEQLSAALADLEKTLAKTQAKIDEAFSSIEKRVDKSGTSIAGRLNQISGSVAGFGNRLSGVGGQISNALGPLNQAADSALDTALTYEKAMNELQAASGASADKMQQAAATAQALDADLSLPATSALDAAQAMAELSKAGFNVDQSMAAARGTLQLAAAGQLSQAEAAEIAVGALNAFNLNADDSARVANLLAGAARASAGDVKDLGEGLKTGAGAFAASGQTVDSLTTALGLMANAGVEGAEAGTALSTIMQTLAKPSDEVNNKLKNLGISVAAGQGKLMSFRDIVGQFSDKMDGMDEATRNATLATIFGKDAVESANAALLGGVQAYDQMHAAVTRENAATELAATQTQGLGGAMEELKSQLETIFLKLATPMLGTLEGLAEVLSSVLNRISQLNPNVLAGAGAFLAVLAVVGPLLVTLGMIAGAIAFLISPIGLVIAGIALLAAIIAFLVANNFFGLGDHIAAVGSTIASFFGELGTRLQAIREAFVQAVPVIVGALLLLLNPFTLLVAALVFLVTTVVGTFFGMGEAIRLLWQGLLQWIVETVGPFVTAIIDLFSFLYHALVGGSIIPDMVNAIVGWITWLKDGVILLITTLKDTVVNLVTMLKDGAIALVTGLKDTAIALFTGLKDIAVNLVTTLKDRVIDRMSGLKNTAVSIVTSLKDTTVNLFQSTWDTVTGLVQGGVNTVIGFINQLIRAWNGLEFHIPGFSVTLPSAEVPGVGTIGGGSLGWPGVTVSTPDLPEIPLLGAGGIATRPTLAVVGDVAEAIIPLRELDRIAGVDEEHLAKLLADEMARHPRFVINPTYRDQGERRLRDDVRLLQLLGAAT